MMKYHIHFYFESDKNKSLQLEYFTDHQEILDFIDKHGEDINVLDIHYISEIEVLGTREPYMR
jgi:hypothetical protein